MQQTTNLIKNVIESTHLPVNGSESDGNSFKDFKIETTQFILDNFQKDITIIDVGPGSGIYSRILKGVCGYDNIDCVEAFAKHAESYQYDVLYRNTFIIDVIDFDFEHYNLAIFGDILEHLSVKDAQKVMNRFMEKTDCIIIQVPYKYVQGDHWENKYEVHIQDDLTHEIFMKRYPYMELLERNSRCGVYTWMSKLS